jgi:pimeloyl-ACP methyl ester carboxylesterase
VSDISDTSTDHGARTSDPTANTLIDGFTSATAEVNGITLHYVRGGSGPALLLVHGFPQDWYEWRGVMSRLATSFTVIAVDLRGVGRSDAPREGYDAATMAEDLHQLAEQLQLGPVYIAGHDIGGWVAYAYARLFHDTTSGAMVLETLLPGIEPFAHADIDVALWHGEFHMIPDLPEALVAGRQAIYFRYFFDIGTRSNDVITEADLQHYAGAYGDADHLRAAFEVYRAIPNNIVFNSGQQGAIDVPLLLAGGERVFGPLLEDVAANLRTNFGWSDVEVEIIDDGQHYVVEERPDDVIGLIERHAGPRDDVPANR